MPTDTCRAVVVAKDIQEDVDAAPADMPVVLCSSGGQQECVPSGRCLQAHANCKRDTRCAHGSFGVNCFLHRRNAMS
jgi:hypothetical protein